MHQHIQKLNQHPFSITPDPDFFYFSETHRITIENILFGISRRLGFFLLTGEVGTGKTTICRYILDSLKDSAKTAYIINPSVSGRELIANILDDLGIDYSSDLSKKNLIGLLNRFVLNVPDSKPVVIIIDEAQTMPVGTLEDLRLLANLETTKSKLLQILIVGQPELISTISRPEMRQLKHRITINCCLEYLTINEVEDYISRRLYVAGNMGHIKFTRNSLKLIYKASNGIPRIINKICFYALFSAYNTNDYIVGSKHIKNALKELASIGFKKDYNFFLNWMKKIRQNSQPGLMFASSVMVICVAVFALIFFNHSDFVFSMDNKNNSILAATYAPVHTKGNKSAGKEMKIPKYETAVSITKQQTEINPYTVLLGSFKTLPLTLQAVSKYAKRGISAKWCLLDLDDNNCWYRVFTQRFKSKNDAALYIKEYGLKDSIVLRAPWEVLIVEDDISKDIYKIKGALNNSLHDAYIETHKNGLCRLITGAFTTYEGALNAAKQINTLGFPVEVISR